MANVYEYTMINQSPTLDVVIGAKITEAPCKAVKLSTGKAVLPSAGEIPLGILLISSEPDLEAGAEATVLVKDIGLWRAGGTFAAGDMLAADASGTCQKASAGQYMFARALEDAAKGDLVRVQIVNAGYAAGA